MLIYTIPQSLGIFPVTSMLIWWRVLLSYLESLRHIDPLRVRV